VRFWNYVDCLASFAVKDERFGYPLHGVAPPPDRLKALAHGGCNERNIVSRNPTTAPCQGTARHILVMAKAPQPGAVKTRLCPPLSFREAADLAAASLADTLAAVADCHAERKIVALHGEPGEWLPSGFEIIKQSDGGLDRRLAAAWGEAGGPGLQIGMDTPQASAQLLDECLEATFRPGTTASLGLAADGGWWAIGLSASWHRDIFTGVPMSTPATGQLQLRRLRQLGHTVAVLPELRDVDHIRDARIVSAVAPQSRFASTFAELTADTRLTAS
jgi:glycosyltransferase A (GT-A) superfamily protein (DUF2064 family)